MDKLAGLSMRQSSGGPDFNSFGGLRIVNRSFYPQLGGYSKVVAVLVLQIQLAGVIGKAGS